MQTFRHDKGLSLLPSLWHHNLFTVNVTASNARKGNSLKQLHSTSFFSLVIFGKASHGDDGWKWRDNDDDDDEEEEEEGDNTATSVLTINKRNMASPSNDKFSSHRGRNSPQHNTKSHLKTAHMSVNYWL